MNKFTLILFLILPSSLIFAGNEETLFGEHYHSGGYGGPVWKTTELNGQTAFLSGGRGGWIINHTWVIGGGGYSLISDLELDDLSTADQPLYMDMSYGGFEVEYINDSDNLYHWTIHTTFGGGDLRVHEQSPNKKIESDEFFIVEPSFNIDININSWFRIGGGVSYRFISGLDLNYVEDKDLSGASGLIILKFGSF